MHSQETDLKQENEELKALVATYKIQLKQYQEAHEQMRHQLNELIRHRFGAKSERSFDSNSPQQDLFTTELGINTADSNVVDEDDVTVPEHKRRKSKSKNTDTIPRDIVVIPVADEDRVCNCGCEKQLVRYETSERYDYQPEIYSVLEERREIMACPKGCEGSLQTAPLPKRVLPKIKATESLLAHIIVSKLHNRQPLYHLEKYTEMVNISRETMARWMIQLAGPLQPLLNLFKDEIIEYDVASLDATTLQVLKEPGRSAETKSYIYCMRGGSPEHATIVYDYNYERHKLYVDEWFEGFQGYIHMDADPFFEMLLEDEQVNAVNCHAHGRRKFEAITKQVKKQGLAHDALQFYKKLYKIEREAKNQAMTPEQRYHYRLEHSKPLLDKFKVWLDEYYPLTLPKSYLGKAMEYCLKRWDNFLCFLKDGRLEIDNNLTEQEIKPIVIARKNFMFADSVKGAHALCLHFSLIRTALAHKLAPYKYYKAILTRIPHCDTVEDYEALLPWNIQL